MVYHPDLGGEADAENKILFFHPSATPLADQVRCVGLSEALSNFASSLAPGTPCESMHTQNRRYVFEQVEPNIWMVLVVQHGSSDSQEEGDSQVGEAEGRHRPQPRARSRPGPDPGPRPPPRLNPNPNPNRSPNQARPGGRGRGGDAGRSPQGGAPAHLRCVPVRGGIRGRAALRVRVRSTSGRCSSTSTAGYASSA